jgi:hypothetical protein
MEKGVCDLGLKDEINIIMKKKIIIFILGVLLLYIASYILVCRAHIEIWEKDKNAYVIFPENKILYYMYRPISLIDGKLTGMRFHIGPHQ